MEQEQNPQIGEFEELDIERATYDPEDNKIRIYSGYLPKWLYGRLRDAGFGRAPVQGCFFGTWTPEREDIAIELCGEIEDEDSTLMDRAEARSVRFAQYSENAAARAEAAIKASHSLVNGIPLGQPILVGHHSEKRHRKALERSRREAEKTVDEVRRRDYWEWRAKGVERHAQNKGARATTMRRIKRLESDLRSHRKDLGNHQKLAQGWQKSIDEKDPDLGRRLSSIDFVYIKPHALDAPEGQASEGSVSIWSALEKDWIHPLKAAQIAIDLHTRSSLRHERWIEHLEGQILYWKTALQDEHGIDIDQQMPLVKGCWIRCAYGWGQAVRINKGAGGKISSVTVNKNTAIKLRSGWFPTKIEYPSILEWSPNKPEQIKVKADPTPRATVKDPDPLMSKAQEKLERAESTELVVNWDPGYYATPQGIVDQMLDLAQWHVGNPRTLLEPGAGDGRIILAARKRWPFVQVGWYEINYSAIQHLDKLGLTPMQKGADFLEADPGLARYQLILMNPSFAQGVWMQHLQQAWDFLEPGGVLISVLPGKGNYKGGSPSTGAMGVRSKLLIWLDQDDRQYDTIELPDGTFKESGTGVRTHLLILKKLGDKAGGGWGSQLSLI